MGEQNFCVVLGVLFKKIKPYLLMVSLQFGYAWMSIISVLCMKRGLSHYVLVVYGNFVAMVAVAPFAWIFERKIRPKMTISTFLKIVVLGGLEPVLSLNLFYVGMRYTSATFASAIQNGLPAVTFIIAIIIGLERINIKKLRSQAKVVGTIVTVCGGMIMSVYKGPIIDMVWSRGRAHHGSNTNASDQHWLSGTVMIIISVFGWSAFIILQSITLKTYPAELSLTTLICFMGVVEGAAVALVMEHNFSEWALGWDSRLLAPIISGVIGSALSFYVQGVVMKERDPVFVTAFSPMNMIFVAVLGSLILAEKIYLGSLIGAIIIVIGLYSVIWGKSKDHLISSPLTNEKGETPELPTMTDEMKTNISIDIEGDSTTNDGITIPMPQK